MLSGKAMLSRRHTMRAMSAALVGVGMASCSMNPLPDLIPQGLGLALTPQPLTDPAVFNFALNLEYLEAEYYIRGMTGQGLADADIGPAPKAVRGGRKVNFQTPVIREFMGEIAADEQAHVRFLRAAIANTPLVQSSRPAIDLEGSFRAAGAAAGLGPNFDPFADEDSFLLGAFIFEDVGVTAYAGAAGLLSQAPLIEAAAGILAVEAYHAGLIRAALYSKSEALVRKADAISAAREMLDGPMVKEEAPSATGVAIISPCDENGIAFKRTPQQVMNIAFLTAEPNVDRGGFFPEGLNGVVRHT
ncbi:MAG: ferritin-like domain-containing protein [Pseudomonadota bacterium]|nr:ferritin-like domain-containing protein [Pseudomonadota bacterium]